jgi:hypothetical protein
MKVFREKKSLKHLKWHWTIETQLRKTKILGLVGHLSIKSLYPTIKHILGS